MNAKKKCIAMLLAGGQGSRLYALTQSVAKPAVPYGGKYRIIDFALSNCTNSGIDTVGVLTQYQPQYSMSTSATVSRGIWIKCTAVCMYSLRLKPRRVRTGSRVLLMQSIRICGSLSVMIPNM